VPIVTILRAMVEKILWHGTDWRYRIAPEPLIPDSINWDHVAPEWTYMAMAPERQ
jgi:hypothetical protein